MFGGGVAEQVGGAGSLGERQVERYGLVGAGGGGRLTLADGRSTTKMAGRTGGAAFLHKVVFACHHQLILARFQKLIMKWGA